MKRLHLLAAACAAALALPVAVQAGTATFGLFIWGGCGHCSPCPRPYNAFSAICCGYPANPDMSGYGCGSHGCGSFGHRFGHFGHARGNLHDGPYQGPYWDGCGSHGHGRKLGCSNPFGGCGTKRTLCARISDWKLKHTADVGLEGTEWGTGHFAKLMAKFGIHKLGGGHIHSDGVFESSSLIVSDVAAPGCASCGSSAAPTGPPPAAMPAPIKQTGYAPAVPQSQYPAQGYYYYQTPWGYYPAYAYPMGY